MQRHLTKGCLQADRPWLCLDTRSCKPPRCHIPRFPGRSSEYPGQIPDIHSVCSYNNIDALCQHHTQHAACTRAKCAQTLQGQSLHYWQQIWQGLLAVSHSNCKQPIVANTYIHCCQHTQVQPSQTASLSNRWKCIA